MRLLKRRTKILIGVFGGAVVGTHCGKGVGDEYDLKVEEMVEKQEMEKEEIEIIV